MGISEGLPEWISVLIAVASLIYAPNNNKSDFAETSLPTKTVTSVPEYIVIENITHTIETLVPEVVHISDKPPLGWLFLLLVICFILFISLMSWLVAESEPFASSLDGYEVNSSPLTTGPIYHCQGTQTGLVYLCQGTQTRPVDHCKGTQTDELQTRESLLINRLEKQLKEAQETIKTLEKVNLDAKDAGERALPSVTPASLDYPSEDSITTPQANLGAKDAGDGAVPSAAPASPVHPLETSTTAPQPFTSGNPGTQASAPKLPGWNVGAQAFTPQQAPSPPAVNSFIAAHERPAIEKETRPWVNSNVFNRSSKYFGLSKTERDAYRVWLKNPYSTPRPPWVDAWLAANPGL